MDSCVSHRNEKCLIIVNQYCDITKSPIIFNLVHVFNFNNLKSLSYLTVKMSFF